MYTYLPFLEVKSETVSPGWKKSKHRAGHFQTLQKEPVSFPPIPLLQGLTVRGWEWALTFKAKDEKPAESSLGITLTSSIVT